MMNTHPPLTNLQLELLKLYSLELTEAELIEVKHVLARHFANRLNQRVEKIWQDKGLTANDMEQWLNEENQ
jgi:hypothetical protein